MQQSKLKSLDFLKIADQFKLGELTTEKRHPLTMNLSLLSKTNLPKAVEILKSIDLSLFDVLQAQFPNLLKLKNIFSQTINSGGRIFFSGCGSTGRLSLTLEFLWRQSCEVANQECVIGMMAGGDSALIKAIEDFEDHPEYAHRHLSELGFRDGDLLVGSSEGGETPFVIGSVEYALKHTKIKPWFVYCNPDNELIKTTQRSKIILQNNSINKLNLTCGPMAISGSTRMQASTIILYALGLALLSTDEPNLKERFFNLKDTFQKLNLDFLPSFIELESSAYEQGYLLNYLTNNLGVTILTDTTERAPTFNLTPFENCHNKTDLPALCNLSLLETTSAKQAWNTLLMRKPRCLNWKEFPITNLNYFYGFDISASNLKRRQEITAPHSPIDFTLLEHQKVITWNLQNLKATIDCSRLDHLEIHLLQKMLLNIHSTLVMGRMNRYEGNLMTYVKPSCNKLIDRAIRYVTHLLKDHGITRSYEEICHALFDELEHVSPSDPIVLLTLYKFTKSTITK